MTQSVLMEEIQKIQEMFREISTDDLVGTYKEMRDQFLESKSVKPLNVMIFILLELICRDGGDPQSVLRSTTLEEIKDLSTTGLLLLDNTIALYGLFDRARFESFHPDLPQMVCEELNLRNEHNMRIN